MAQSCALLLFDGTGEFQGMAAELGGLGIAVQTVAAVDGIVALAAGSGCLLVVICPTPEASAMGAACDACYALSERCPETPVMACCANPTEDERLALLEAGAEDVVAPASLADAVLRAIPAERRSPKRQAKGELYMKAGASELPNVVQFLAFTGRTGKLEVAFAEGGEPGGIFVQDGAVAHAEYEGLGGVEALAWMFLMGAAEVHFYDGRLHPVRTIQGAVDSVLIEAAVLADELQAGRLGKRQP